MTVNFFNFIAVGDAGLSAMLYLLENKEVSPHFTFISSTKKITENETKIRSFKNDVKLISLTSTISYSELTNKIYSNFNKNSITFIVSGLSGELSSAITPKLTEITSKLSSKTTVFGIMPFTFEGEKKKRKAVETFTKLKEITDDCIELENQNLFKRANVNTTFTEAFRFFNQDILAHIKKIK